MAATQSSIPPSPVVPLFRNTCTICGFPIRPGPEWVDESRAKVHRECLRRDVHDLAVESECQDIWLQAYGLLCEMLPRDEVKSGIVPLAKEYQARLNSASYLDFLERVSPLVRASSLPEHERRTVECKLLSLRDRIARLVDTKTPPHD